MSQRSHKRIRLVSFERDATGAVQRQEGVLGPQAAERWRAAQANRRSGTFGFALDQSPRGRSEQSPPPFDAALNGHMDADNPELDSEDEEDPEAASRRVVDAFMRLNHYNKHRLDSSHNWGRRRAATRANWLAQRESLVDAYLGFIHSAKSSGAPQPTLYPEYSVPADDIRVINKGYIHLVDISGIYRLPLLHFTGAQYINATLLTHGYLGSAPIRPSIAFSLRTLLFFGRLRTRARTGKHNFVRALCDLHNITFHRSFRNRFADTADALAAIQRHVDNLINTALGRSNEWRMTDGCPACSYKCVGEEPLVFSRQLALDGNNSMKRFITSNTAFESPYPCRYIRSRDEVDLYKDEVRRAGGPSQFMDTAAGTEHDTTIDTQDECTDRWRNARPENEKTASWEAQDETGIFVCVCRHGLVVTATDMWQSGELAKYPLAIDKALLDLFGHEGVLQIGYDIGCAHSGTAARSSFGARVHNELRFVVGSFHGHAHNRRCQLRFHPRYVVGSGREDFEGCERLFSVNNFVAPLVRHATRYHRHELIEASFAAWDAEKYASVGTLLLSKYKEAKAKIIEHALEEERRKRNPQYTDAYFTQLLEDEYQYLSGNSTVSQASLQEQLAEEYSAALRRWWSACADRQKYGGGATPFIAHDGGSDVQVRKWLGAQRRVQNAEIDLQGYEHRLGIGSHERWTAESHEYLTARKAKKLHSYAAALDALERGVADRMAVLERLNKRETCYKLRREISKSAKKRGTALANLLDKYNDAALALEPPRPTLTREEVFDLAFLSDFPVLRPDVADKPWAQRSVRKMTTAWAETARAQEELQRIRIECARIRAWIRDEEPALDAHIARLEGSHAVRDQLLAKELDARTQLLFHQHTEILEALWTVDELDGLSNPRPPGLRPVQNPELAYAIRAASRQQRPPLVLPLVGYGPHTHTALTTAIPDNDSESSGDRSMLDEVEGDNLDGFFTAMHALVI